MKASIHYLNDKWVGRDELKVSAFDLAVTRGLSVFETFRTFNKNKVFRLEDHLRRLRRSIKELYIPLNIDENNIRRIISEGIDRNGFDETTIRITITAGINEGRLSSSQPNLIVMFMPLSVPDRFKYAHGIKLTTHKELRTIPDVKTSSYIAAKRGLHKALVNGGDDAVFVDKDDHIYETTISNIFFARNNQLITPGKGILPGITRQTVIDIASNSGIEVNEADVYLKEIASFNECFVTGSIKGVMPVSAIDAHTFSPVPGPMTSRVIHQYNEAIGREAEPII